MKETSFVKHNRGKWEKFERLFKKKNNDPDEISELFTEITEDLSYARTFYPRRSVRVYLNQLAQGVFTSLYKQKKQPIRGFFKFWKETIPLAMYKARKNILMALLFFTGATILGAVSQHYDNSFVELIMGEHYVRSTEDRIAAGDPMGIYGETGEASMFFHITTNNIKVAFYAFISGICFGLITYFIMLKNGVMLGAFQWWFKAKGLLLTSFLAIWIHGAFEISAIVIAGGAGITLGNGLLFPRSHSRLQSLIFSGKQGMIILTSLVPIFIMAGALESFVTRYYQSMSPVLNWFIILGSFSIIILYYGIYPFIVAKKHPDKLDLLENPRYIPKRNIKLKILRTPGELFTDTTYTFVQNSKLFTLFSSRLIITLSLILGGFIIYTNSYDFNYNRDWFENFELFFGYDDGFELYKYLGWSFVLALTFIVTHFIVSPKHPEKTLSAFFKLSTFKYFHWHLLFFIGMTGIFLILNWFLFILFVVLLGFLVILVPVIVEEENTNLFSAIGKSFSLLQNSYGLVVGALASLGAVIIIFFFVLHNPFEISFLTLMDELIMELLVGSTFYYDTVINAFNCLIYILFAAFVFELVFTYGFYLYHTLTEKQSAVQLKADIETIGKRSKSFETKLEFE